MNSSTIQNLAIMYSKRAISKAERDDMPASRKDFENALKTASCSSPALSNLSISLYNDAIANVKEGKDDLGIMLLKESDLAYPSVATFESLGDVYYKKTDLEKARFYYGKALAYDPQDIKIKKKMQKAVKELELAGREESKESPHFELRYDKSLQVDS